MTDEETGIFSDLIGRSGAKAILRAALRGGEVDVLLCGEPGSGKSVALLCIEENVPGSRKLDSSGVSKSKLRDVLSSDPPIVLLDELDDARDGVYEAISEPLEDRRVTKAVQGNEMDVEIRTQFFAASNSTDPLPSHIEDRFQIVWFPEYSDGEFVDVCETLLPRITEWLEAAEDARLVAEAVMRELGSKDVRDARDVARLSGARERIESIAQALNDPEADVESDPITVSEIAACNVESEAKGVKPNLSGPEVPSGEDPREYYPDDVVTRVESTLEGSGRRPTQGNVRSLINQLLRGS